MGRNKAEEDGQQRKSTSKKPVGRVNGLYSFHPTEADKKVLRDLPWGLLEAINELEDLVQSGCRLNVSYIERNGAVSAIIRAPGEDWTKAPAVSAVHTSVERAIITLAYALQTRCPRFPAEMPTGTQLEFDW